MATAVVTQQVTRDDVFTRHDYNVLRPGYKDNYWNGRQLLRLLRENKVAYNGGKFMSLGVNLGAAAVGGSFGKGERGTFTDLANTTDAIYTPTYIREPRVIYLQDEVEAGGSDVRQLTLAEEKTGEAMQRIMETTESQICQTSKADSKDLNTLIEAISDGATGAFGTLNPASAGQAAWANQDSGNFDFSASAVATLRTARNNASAGNQFSHDVVLLTQTYHEQWLEVGDAKIVINEDARTSGGTTNAELAMMNASFYDRPVIWSKNWSDNQANKGLMLDLKGIQLAIHPGHEFRFSPWRSAEVDFISARVSLGYLIGQLVMDSRRTQAFLGTLS